MIAKDFGNGSLRQTKILRYVLHSNSHSKYTRSLREALTPLGADAENDEGPHARLAHPGICGMGNALRNFDSTAYYSGFSQVVAKIRAA
jgi:hypothetical protein